VEATFWAADKNRLMEVVYLQYRFIGGILNSPVGRRGRKFKLTVALSPTWCCTASPRKPENIVAGGENSMSRVILKFAVWAPIVSASTAHAALYTSTVLYSLNKSGLNAGVTGQLGGGFDQQVVSGGQVAGRGAPGTGTNEHALLWASPSPATDLNPTGFTESFGYGTSGSQQVGMGYGTGTGNNDHALVWNGSAASAVDLNPTGFSTSVANGTSGIQQAGSGTLAAGNNTHALIWQGTAASAVDLNPTNVTGYTQSDAIGTDGLHQVGRASGTATGGYDHAMLWNGVAASAVDLNPSAYTSSIAYGVGGAQQVGEGQGSGSPQHAMLWTGSASTAIDLNPSSQGITVSLANDTNGTVQAGWGFGSSTGGYDEAYMWSGSANSAVDLQSLLPVNSQYGYWSQSFAYTVDSSGDIFGLAYDSNTPGTFVVEWSPVPEPSALMAITAVAFGHSLRRKSSRQ
jgi:hypothetical protein